MISSGPSGLEGRRISNDPYTDVLGIEELKSQKPTQYREWEVIRSYLVENQLKERDFDYETGDCLFDMTRALASLADTSSIMRQKMIGAAEEMFKDGDKCEIPFGPSNRPFCEEVVDFFFDKCKPANITRQHESRYKRLGSIV
ncbi:hypothetical protein AKO1_005864 [Acrasis kona]|uniref:Uncharacterized protein n=1 Tax=Acrasis kona TaxID=1008807 RepID=A0AAW2YIF2_9EUKA